MLKSIKRLFLFLLVYSLGKKYVIPYQEKLTSFFQKIIPNSDSSQDEDWGPKIIKIEKGDKNNGY